MDPTPKALKALSWATAVLFAVALYLVLFYAPREAVMGDVQRVFYFHVAAGWVGALAFLITAVAGAVFLARRDRRWDNLATASVEIGVGRRRKRRAQMSTARSGSGVCRSMQRSRSGMSAAS